ncbi:Fungalysin metallopeptidase-domain-containing protein [Hysterangium stoloniferum]|nr:Fungalysin metallopeptidase-domain-containing protein [Hysterangium stoloniferum]
MVCSKLAAIASLALYVAPTLASTITNIVNSTYWVQDVSPGKQLNAFFPKSTFTTFGEGLDVPPVKRDGNATTEEAALSFVKSQLNVTDDDLMITSSYDSDVAKHAFLIQKINGVPVANAVANVAFNHANKVVAFGYNFIKPSSVPPPTPSLKVADAISKAEAALSIPHNNWPTSVMYFAKDDNTLVLSHVIQLQNNVSWVEAFINAHSGELANVHNFVSHASYNVIPINSESPRTSNFTTIVNPQDISASPLGWHSDGAQSFLSTAGNNAAVIDYTTRQPTLQSSSVLNFNYIWNPFEDPMSLSNVQTARVNAFYVMNSMHDITYKYGFTEVAFNFQQNNFGRGGRGGDRVLVTSQDLTLPNNAMFATPPEGQSGTVRVGIFQSTLGRRDADVDNSILVHEYTHGVTTRLTGGGGVSNCLNTARLGEGWSDAVADWMVQGGPLVRDFSFGLFPRHYPYSTSMTVNPYTYASAAGLNENIGEIWATMLHDVQAALVQSRGFSFTARTDPTPVLGNVIFLHLLIDALPLQGCNPTFITARNAIFQADLNRYGGSNRCILWRAFARRGLGVNAFPVRNDFTFPLGC